MGKKFVARKYRYFFKYIKTIYIVLFILFGYIYLYLKIDSNFYNIFIKSGLNMYKYYIDLPSYMDIFNYNLNKDISVVNNREDLVIEPNNAPIVSEPIIYIYNSHDTEEYLSNMLEAYNISYTVKTASYILSEYLNSMGIESIVESRSVVSYLKENNLKYTKSYSVSRSYIEDILIKYPSIKYIIDLHRDGVKHEYSTINIDGTDYAKVMFVMATGYEGYSPSLDLANKISLKLGSISRGVTTRSNVYIYGTFNQDIMDNALLMEVGGNESNIKEVNATLYKVATILKDIIYEN